MYLTLIACATSPLATVNWVSSNRGGCRGSNPCSGATTIGYGYLQLGDGGSAGMVGSGAIVNNGTDLVSGEPGAQRDENDAALGGAEVVPHRVGSFAQRGDDAQTRDDDAASAHSFVGCREIRGWPSRP